MSEVRRLWIPGPAGRIEAALRVACPARALAVVAHPHPEGGGTMHHPVVFHAERRLHRAGFTTMRFNFRGVGESEGRHDGGRGEVADVAASASWLRGLAPGASLLLVGYSFGSWCSIRHALDDRAVRGVIGIGLPVRVYPFDEVARLGCPLAVVQGEHDEYGEPAEVRRLLDLAEPPGELRVVPGASHLFPKLAERAAVEVAAAAEAMLAGAGVP